jgi:hypothetical protein
MPRKFGALDYVLSMYNQLKKYDLQNYWWHEASITHKIFEIMPGNFSPAGEKFPAINLLNKNTFSMVIRM